jgi:hypothetical protein
MYIHPPMDLTLAAIKRRLDKNKLAYGELDLQSGVKLLVLERGGRVFGPFLTPESNTLLWVSSALADSEALTQFIVDNQWNAGGERIWVAPEIQFNVSDRKDFWGTISIPVQMDPGDWRLDEQLDGVTYAGYEQIVTLREAKHDDIMSQSWNVTPVWPGGRIIIPSTPAVEVSDYFEPIDDQHLARHGHYIALQVTGDRRYKVGVKAAQTFGRLGYFHRRDDGSAYLIVRNYFNNPSSPYVEEPPQTPGGGGDSIHVYNDGGLFGGFGELECHGQTIGGHTGRTSSTDQQILWVYSGPTDKVARIGWQLLGVEL